MAMTQICNMYEHRKTHLAYDWVFAAAWDTAFYFYYGLLCVGNSDTHDLPLEWGNPLQGGLTSNKKLCTLNKLFLQEIISLLISIQSRS